MALLAMGLALVLAAAARPSPQSSASANAALQSTTRNTSAQSTKIVLLGTGTPSPDPDRSGPATAVVVNGTPYLIDFGPGVVRRIGRMERDALWTQEEAWPRTIFLPDEVDQRNEITSHMSMKVKIHGGVYFGFLIPYVPKEQLWTELILSRDGESFERTHAPFVSTGAPGAWDRGQAWAAPDWVEVGDEWWITYHGSDRGPNVAIPKDTSWGIGLAKIRKEGFVSLRGPRNGGVVCTRVLRWPGGKLLLNAAAREGLITVRVSGPERKVIPGFDHADCVPFRGDSIAAEVRWKNKTLGDLAGQPLRLEIYIANGDLYSFHAER